MVGRPLKLWILCVALGAGACGTGASSAPSGGAGSKGGSGPVLPGDAWTADSGTGGTGSSPAGSGVLRICGLTRASGETCAGVDAYVQCLETVCNDALSRCFGTSYAQSDYTGSVCADYAQCATASSSCNGSCTPSSPCQTCLTTLVGCIQASACTAPYCTGGTGTGGAPPVDAGGSPDGGVVIQGTCADLQACCASIQDPSGQSACVQTLADARARAGDPDCAVVLSTYRAAGICP